MAISFDAVSTIPPGNAALWERRLELEQRYTQPGKTELDFNRQHMYTIANLAKVGLGMVGLWQRGRNNSLKFVLHEDALLVPDLPEALVGLRILHLSDFHFSKFDPRLVDGIVDLLSGLEVDLCCVTGDYKYGHMGDIEHIAPAMERVLGAIQSRNGAVGILGNHDFSCMIPPLESAGLRMLVNGGFEMVMNGCPVWIGGTDDPHNYRCADVSAAMAGASEEAFKIIMVHSPECIPEAEAAGASVYLCGHTHGGQICFPVVGMLKSNARCERQYAEGLWRYEQLAGHTTRGLGVTDIPVRFLCPPEASVLTLGRA